jgi:hypothetical protein
MEAAGAAEGFFALNSRLTLDALVLILRQTMVRALCTKTAFKPTISLMQATSGALTCQLG